MNRAPHLLLVAAAASVLAACGSAVAPAAGGGLDGDWTLTVGTLDGEPLAVTDAAPVTMTVAADEVSGRSACNSYTGAVDVVGDAVTFTGLGGTDMGCQRDVMLLETAYQQALGRVGTATATGDTLTLTGDGVELTFAPEAVESPTALVGTQWLLETLVAGSDPDASASSAGRRSFLTLSEDGTWEADGGCNHLTGTWQRAGDVIETADLGSTAVACEGDVAEQERHVFDVLAGPFTAVITGDVLTLSSDDGRGLAYRPAP